MISKIINSYNQENMFNQTQSQFSFHKWATNNYNQPLRYETNSSNADGFKIADEQRTFEGDFLNIIDTLRTQNLKLAALAQLLDE